MLTFIQHLHKEIPFLIEAVEDFVNRYMKLHAEHPKVQNSPEEARKLIAAAHPHAQGHHEAVYLTRSLLDGEYNPEKDDAIMRSDLGAWRKFSNKHKDKIKSGLTKKEIPEISSLSRKDLAGQLSIDEKNPLPGLEEYHIGTIEHPELGTVDVHHVLHKDMVKKFPRSDLRTEEYTRISRIKSNHCPVIPGKSEGQRMCTISSGNHIENYAQGSGYFFFTHRNREKLNSVPELIMGAGDGDRAGLVNTYNEKIDPKTADSIHNQVRKLLPIEKKLQYDLRYTPSEAKPYSFEELKGIIDNVVDKHKKIAEKRMIERHGKDFDVEKQGLGFAEIYDRNDKILEDLRPHIMTLDKARDDHRTFEIASNLTEHDPEQLRSPDTKKQMYPHASLIEKHVLNKLGRHLHDTLVGLGRKTISHGESTPLVMDEPSGMKAHIKSAIRLISEPEDIRHVLKFHLDRTKIPPNEENASQTRGANTIRNGHFEMALDAASGNHQLGLDEANKLIEHFKTSPIAQDRNTNHRLLQAEFLGSAASNPNTSSEDLHKVIDRIKEDMIDPKGERAYLRHYTNSVLSNKNFNSSHAHSLLDYVQTVIDNPESTTDEHYRAGEVIKNMTQAAKYAPESQGRTRLKIGQSRVSADILDRIHQMMTNQHQKIRDELAAHGHTIETARRDPNFQPGGPHARILDRRGSYYLNQEHEKEILDTMYRDSVMSPELIHKHIDMHLDNLQRAANLKKYDPNSYNKAAKHTLYYSGAYRVTDQEEQSMSSISDILDKQVNVNDDHIRHILTSPFIMENHNSDIVKAHGGVMIQATQHPAIREYTARMLMDHPSRHISSFAKTSHVIPRQEADEHIRSGSVDANAHYRSDMVEKAPTIEGIIKQKKEAGTYPRGLIMPTWMAFSDNYHSSVIPKTQETTNIPQQANENKSMDFISLLNEELLLEAKVDQFVNRYMNHHKDHQLVMNDPEEARKRISSAHGIGNDHLENVYLTTHLLDGKYRPNEDEETMRAHMGMVRRAIAKGHMKKEDMEKHTPSTLGSFFSRLESIDPAFEYVEPPIKGNPEIKEMSNYKVGTIMPHSKTQTRRIDKNLPIHVYHITPEKVSQNSQNTDLEYKKLSKTIEKYCPKDATICVRRSPELLRHYSQGHGFLLYAQGGKVVRAHGYKDQGIVTHKNYPIPEEESEHIIKQTSSLLSGTSKMVYDIYASMHPAAFADPQDGDVDEDRYTDEYDPHPINISRSNLQEKFKDVTPMQLKVAYSKELKRFKREKQKGARHAVYYPERLRRIGHEHNLGLIEERATKRSAFIDAVHDLVDKHLSSIVDREHPSPIDGTPFAHQDFIKHVIRRGQVDPTLIDKFSKSKYLGSDDIEHILSKVESSPAVSTDPNKTYANMREADANGLKKKHRRLLHSFGTMVNEAAKNRFLTADQVDRIFDLHDYRQVGSYGGIMLSAKHDLISSKSPHVTAQHIDKYLDTFPLDVHDTERLTRVFEHPNHTREHVDRILSPDNHLDIGKDLVRRRGRFINEGIRVRLANRAFANSPHITEEEITDVLTGKHFSPDSGDREQHNVEVAKAYGLMENPILKPHHISMILDNYHRYELKHPNAYYHIFPGVSDPESIIVNHPSFTDEHAIRAIDQTTNPRLTKLAGANATNPEVIHHAIRKHFGRLQSKREAGIKIDPYRDNTQYVSGVLNNQNLDRSHIDAIRAGLGSDITEQEHAVLDTKLREIEREDMKVWRKPYASYTQRKLESKPREKRQDPNTGQRFKIPRRMQEGFLSFLDFVLQ